MNVKDRLKKLENVAHASDDSVALIYIRFVGMVNGKPSTSPLMGWRFSKEHEHMDVMRLDGETDQALAERAASLARESKGSAQGAMVLMEITND